jgi:NDP-sugar pyrophosphorylase family protein
MHGLDAQRSLALLPLGDRPMLQHIVESLVAQGINSIELIVGHAPEHVESLLGNGDRWGCRFRYHLEGQPDRPYRSLRIIAETRTEPWVLVHAGQYPCIELPTTPLNEPVLYYGSPIAPTPELPLSSTNGSHGPDHLTGDWRGTAVFPPGAVSEAFANQTSDELYGYLGHLATSSGVSVVHASQWLDVSSPEALLESQTRLLDGRLNGLLISGTERQPGVWISRNVVIHPSVELIPPLYIGPNSRLNRGVKLGPNAVIGGECIVDTNTTIEHSLVTAGSYIGEGLELNRTIVDRNLLINVRLGTSVDVLESFLLGGLKQRRPQNWLGRLLQALVALVLIVLFSPLSLLSALYYFVFRGLSFTSVPKVQIPAYTSEFAARTYPLQCLGSDAWSSHHPAGWEAFFRQFLPGLVSVLSGNIGFVGLPPRSIHEIQALPQDWQTMYLDNKAGLITEASIASGDPEDLTQLYVADAYYAVSRGFLYDLKLAARYFSRLIIPAQKSSK